MIETARWWRLVLGAGAILLCSGCYMYLTSIHLEEGTGSFSVSDEEQAVSAVAGAVDDLGFGRASSEIHTDRRSLRVSLRDAERGSPTTDFDDVLERLRGSLKESFPDARFRTESRRSFRFFAP